MRQVKAIEDVIVHEEDGDAFLLHVATGRYYGLNRSGLIVWNAILSGDDPGDALTKRWPDRPADLLRSDADQLIDRLLEAELVREDA